MADQIHLVTFLINSPINHTVLSWADPADNKLAALGDIHLWQELAKIYERGLFDGMFFADTPGSFERYKDSAEEAVRYGVCWPTHDPVVLLSALAAVTKNLGLAVTVSTGAYHPYTLVRTLSTLDHLTHGRIGWNIVTGHLRGEHRALGMTDLTHDQRYDRADEYMDLCYALWSSTAEDAVIADRERGIYADPAKVGVVQHEGQFFRCHSVAPTLRSPQRRPVLFQAGSSGRGQQFALKHADVVFSIQPHREAMVRFMNDFRATAAAAGVKKVPGVTFGIQPIIGSTEAEAKAKLDALVERIPLDGALARLSGTFGVDFSQFELDRPFRELKTDASQGLMKGFTTLLGDRPFTLREAAVRWGLAVGIPQLVGTPEQVADQIERIWRDSGCHGFNVTPTIMPASVEDLVDQVIPILQKRGIYRTEYTGATFAENLGVA